MKNAPNISSRPWPAVRECAYQVRTRVEREGDGRLGVAARGVQEPGRTPRDQVSEAGRSGERGLKPAIGEGVARVVARRRVLFE
jgi:hypothetical protein